MQWAFPPTKESLGLVQWLAPPYLEEEVRDDQGVGILQVSIKRLQQVVEFCFGQHALREQALTEVLDKLYQDRPARMSEGIDMDQRASGRVCTSTSPAAWSRRGRRRPRNRSLPLICEKVNSASTKRDQAGRGGHTGVRQNRLHAAPPCRQGARAPPSPG